MNKFKSPFYKRFLFSKLFSSNLIYKNNGINIPFLTIELYDNINKLKYVCVINEKKKLKNEFLKSLNGIISILKL